MQNYAVFWIKYVLIKVLQIILITTDEMSLIVCSTKKIRLKNISGTFK